MTWQTSEGDRVLAGAEAELVREVLGMMVDRISENIEYNEAEWFHKFGVELFDSLSSTEQVVIVKEVASHLLTKTSNTIDLTAINEAAVYAIFRTLSEAIEVELDEERLSDFDIGDPEWQIYWRSKTLNAYRECFADDLDEEERASDDPESPWMIPIDPGSQNFEQWNSMTESLADRILWDRDFEMAESFMDASPENAALRKQMLGIDPDYYTSVSMDIAIGGAMLALDSVRKLTHQKPR